MSQAAIRRVICMNKSPQAEAQSARDLQDGLELATNVDHRPSEFKLKN